jgi:hypothetical protein
MPGRVVITPARWIGCICVGSGALYGVEPGARRLGEGGGSVDVVERGSALRSGSAERGLRFGGMAEELDCQCLAAVPSGRRDGIQADGDSSVHPHRAAAGSGRVCAALEGTMKRRLAPLKGGRPPKAGLYERQSELVFESE